jgi:hypothetical protein
MSSILLSNTRYGTRGEYLAHYLLSGTGTVIQVPRQEDTGIDFHCTIGEIFGHSEKFHEHFYIQLKSSSEFLIYGNVEKKGDKVKWKSYELEWLFNLQNPFLIGICNTEMQTLEIYSTSFVWHSFYTQSNICQIKFLLNTPSVLGEEVHARQCVEVEGWKEEFGCENKCCEVPLGPPVLSLTMEDLKKNSSTLLVKKRLLKEIVEDERKNILFRQLKTPYFTWPHMIWTNERYINAFYYATQKLLEDENELLKMATPMLLSLALLYKNEDDFDKFVKIKSLLTMLPLEIIPDNIREKLQLHNE